MAIVGLAYIRRRGDCEAAPAPRGLYAAGLTIVVTRLPLLRLIAPLPRTGYGSAAGGRERGGRVQEYRDNQDEWAEHNLVAGAEQRREIAERPEVSVGHLPVAVDLRFSIFSSATAFASTISLSAKLLRLVCRRCRRRWGRAMRFSAPDLVAFVGPHRSSTTLFHHTTTSAWLGSYRGISSRPPDASITRSACPKALHQK